ncbi:MAG TPA: DUF2834 domain-containing protein [Xanthomonadales bacterium]|nr:DUF2834 domain-containing protein [Xanthomonadales bacterium]
MRNFYFVLAIIGAVVPMYFFIQFFYGGTEAIAAADFIPALFVNGATRGFAADLLITSFVFWVWMWRRRDTGPNMAIFIALNLCIGLSCALPAYLYATTPRQA